MTKDSDNTYPEAFGYMSKAGIPSNLFTEVVDNDEGDLHCKCIFCETVEFTISVPKDYFYCFNCNARGKWQNIKDHVVRYLEYEQLIGQRTLVKRKNELFLQNTQDSGDEQYYKYAIAQISLELDSLYTESIKTRAKACIGDYLISYKEQQEFIVVLHDKQRLNWLNQIMSDIETQHQRPKPSHIFEIEKDVFGFEVSMPALAEFFSDTRICKLSADIGLTIKPNP